MAKRKDMKNLVDRNGWYHFRGYVPKDLIAAGCSRERVESLNTSNHAMAIERRMECLIRHRRWIAETRARRDGQYIILKDLSDVQVIGLARDAYALLIPTIEQHREAQIPRSVIERDAAVQSESLMLSNLESGSIEGSEIFGSFEYYTDKVLERRLLRVDSPSAYSRLVARVGDAIIQIKREQIAAMRGKSGTEINSMFIDIESGVPRTSSELPDGRPNAPVEGNLSVQAQVKLYIDYLANRQQQKNVLGSEATLDIFTQVIGRRSDVRTIKRSDFEDFKALILKLPPNAKKKYPNVSILRIAEIRKEADGYLKPESVNGYLGRLIAFRNWLVETEVVKTMPELRKYKVPDHENIKSKRDIFSLPQMVRLAKSRQFRKEMKNRSVIFWAFAVGFYQGIRQGEIAGLLHSDYIIIDGIPCLRLHPDVAFKTGNKAGKPKTIVREVPIHRVLIALGLPNLFVPSKGEEFVFEEIGKVLAKNPNRQRGDLISRKANRLLSYLGFAAEGYKIVFHSTRHTFEDACKRCNLVDGADNIFGGWTGDDTKSTHYGSGRFELWMKEEIDKISYGEFDSLLIAQSETRRNSTDAV